jgi:hypothetical protein
MAAPPPFVPPNRFQEGDAPPARALLEEQFKWQVQVPPVVLDRYGDEIGPQLAAAETGAAQQAILSELSDVQLNVLAAALGAPLVAPMAVVAPAAAANAAAVAAHAAAVKAADDAYNGGRASTVAAVMAHVTLANYRIAHRTVRAHGRVAPPPAPPPAPTMQEAAAAQAKAREAVRVGSGLGGLFMSATVFNTAVRRDGAGGFAKPYPPWTSVELLPQLTVVTALAVAESADAAVSPPGGWLAVDFSATRVLRVFIATLAERMRIAGVEVGCGTEAGMDRYKPVTLPARKVDPGQKAGTVLKPWRETVGSVLEFSTPADKIMIMRVINVAKAGLEHLLSDYIEHHGEDTDDMGPPLRWWFQFALGKNVVMAPPDPAANPRPGVCWGTLMEPFTKFEAKEREEALMSAAAAAMAAAQCATTAAAAAAARAAEVTRYGAGAKRVRDDDKGGGGSGHGQQGGGGDKRDPKHAKGKDGGRAKRDAAGAGPPLQPYSMRVDPHCVQHPDEKMTDNVCPIHGNGHKRADCSLLVKPGLDALKDEPGAAKWVAYQTAHKCSIVPAVGSSFKDVNP